MRNILQKSIWMVALCIFATSVYAQVSPKKFKKAKGIEVTYQSSYKGKVRPGEMIMKVCGDQVALESVMPKFDPKPADDGRPEYKLPVTKSYMDYAANEYYRWARKLNENSVRVRQTLDVRLRNAKVVDTAADDVERCRDSILCLLSENLYNLIILHTRNNILAIRAEEDINELATIALLSISLGKSADIVACTLLESLRSSVDSCNECRIILALAGE